MILSTIATKSAEFQVNEAMMQAFDGPGVPEVYSMEVQHDSLNI